MATTHPAVDVRFDAAELAELAGLNVPRLMFCRWLIEVGRLSEYPGRAASPNAARALIVAITTNARIL